MNTLPNLLTMSMFDEKIIYENEALASIIRIGFADLSQNLIPTKSEITRNKLLTSNDIHVSAFDNAQTIYKRIILQTEKQTLDKIKRWRHNYINNSSF